MTIRQLPLSEFFGLTGSRSGDSQDLNDEAARVAPVANSGLEVPTTPLPSEYVHTRRCELSAAYGAVLAAANAERDASKARALYCAAACVIAQIEAFAAECSKYGSSV